jgi:hypothetical protein
MPAVTWSVTTPEVVIRATACAPGSEYHSAPSEPAVMYSAPSTWVNGVNEPEAVIWPTPIGSVSHRSPSGPSVRSVVPNSKVESAAIPGYSLTVPDVVILPI